MNVVWHSQAKEALASTARYIEQEFGSRYMVRFLREVYHAEQLISDNPNMGVLEPLLIGRSVLYRSFVVNKLNKIVYYIDDDIVYIADFWDTRREPIAQASQIK